MSYKLNHNHRLKIKRLADSLNLSDKLITKIYMAYWKYIAYVISNMPFDKDYTEDEYKNLKTSINVVGLGKFYCDYKRFNRIRTWLKNLDIIKKKKQHDKCKGD